MNQNKTNTSTKLTRCAAVALAAVLASACLFGCTDNKNANDNANASNANVTTQQTQNATQAPAPAGNAGGDYAIDEWTADKAPNAYVVKGAAIVNYNVNPGEYHYSDLDSLGRAQVAYAGISKNDYVREKGEDREDFDKSADKISGWGHNVKIDVTWPNYKTYKDYFYNRSHLIADSLGGSNKKENGAVSSNGIPKNIVTASRFQNVGTGDGGMVYCEEKVANYLEKASNDAWVYYAATPIYNGDELVPRVVYVDMLSSDGSINEHVEVFNVSGDVTGHITIDYASGYVLKDGNRVEKK